jgi:hypothetical protein
MNSAALQLIAELLAPGGLLTSKALNVFSIRPMGVKESIQQAIANTIH